VIAPAATASLGHSFNTFFNAVGKFFSDLAAVHWGALIIALLFFGANLTLRSRAFLHALKAAYPKAKIQWRRIWGAYFAAIGFNNIVPARGGDLIKLFLVRSSIEDSTFATCYAAFWCESVFDATVGILTLIYAFTQGVFPKPPSFAKLNSFDISWLASNFRLTLFLLTLLGIGLVVLFAVLSVRVQAFWARVRQGLTILFDRRRYFREVVPFLVVAWWCRFASFWFFLEAFRIGASVQHVLLVFGVNQVAGAVPFTPGGAGVQQALFVKVFSPRHIATPPTVIAYSVGQQIAISAFTAGVGLLSVIFIFRFRSFKEVLHAGREAQQAEKDARERANSPLSPRARSMRTRA
jgi:uncharacterized membrane protein YbhN (UPF0104 family)